jgi:hypothetical protein
VAGDYFSSPIFFVRNSTYKGYDLQEPFRWIADIAVMGAFESGVLDLPNFYFTGDDYRYRFDSEAKQRFLDLLRDRFNSGIRYRGHALKWDSVIEQKTTELARYLVGRTEELDFSGPLPDLHETRERELRRQVLDLSYPEARRLGIGKCTLHYLQANARRTSPFIVYSKVRTRLEPAGVVEKLRSSGASTCK